MNAAANPKDMYSSSSFTTSNGEPKQPRKRRKKSGSAPTNGGSAKIVRVSAAPEVDVPEPDVTKSVKIVRIEPVAVVPEAPIDGGLQFYREPEPAQIEVVPPPDSGKVVFVRTV
jgi:hypothetical protein